LFLCRDRAFTGDGVACGGERNWDCSFCRRVLCGKEAFPAGDQLICQYARTPWTVAPAGRLVALAGCRRLLTIMRLQQLRSWRQLSCLGGLEKQWPGVSSILRATIGCDVCSVTRPHGDWMNIRRRFAVLVPVALHAAVLADGRSVLLLLWWSSCTFIVLMHLSYCH